MTIRSQLNLIRRRVLIITLLTWVVFAVGSFLITVHRWFIVVSLLAFIGLILETIFLMFGIRCPKCKAALGHTLSYPPQGLSISDKIKFCPFCGVSLDSEIEIEKSFST